MLAVVDRALAASGNAQVIGRNGELPLRSFLARHLPNTLLAKTGHFVSPSGRMSPQIDTMILDARYPLLAENEDESVLAMLHSVLHCVEVKTNIRVSDVTRICENSRSIIAVSKEVFDAPDGFGNVRCLALAYRNEGRVDNFAGAYFDKFVDESTHTDLYLLRVQERDRAGDQENGVLLHLEPVVGSDDEIRGWTQTVMPIHTPLSDFYYSIIQDSYYCLDTRGFNFSDIGVQIMDYMSWSTAKR